MLTACLHAFCPELFLHLLLGESLVFRLPEERTLPVIVGEVDALFASVFGNISSLYIISC